MKRTRPPYPLPIGLFPLRLVLLTLWVFGQFFAEEAFAQGCAMCRTALTGDDPLSEGIFWSVFVLMAAPFLVAGSIGGWLFYQYRRAQRPLRHTALVVPLRFLPEQKEGQP